MNHISRFLLLFVLSYALLRSLNYAWLGLTIPGNYYSALLDNYADYFTPLRHFILSGASFLLESFGYSNVISGHDLKVNGGKTVHMAYECIGLGVIWVWWSFNMAFPLPLREKISYILIGTLSIILLNMIRIAAVAIFPHRGSILNITFEHHTVFNMVVYTGIILAIFKIINKLKLEG